MNYLKTLCLLLIALAMTGCNSRSDKSGTDGTVTEQQEIAPKREDATLKAPVTVLDFSATWCPPCQRIAPAVHQLADQSKDRVEFKFIDVDQNREMAENYGIQAVPTFVILNAHGQEVRRIEGADFESLASIVNSVEK
jgi:thioredoxin (fragment)